MLLCTWNLRNQISLDNQKKKKLTWKGKETNKRNKRSLWEIIRIDEKWKKLGNQWSQLINYLAKIITIS